MSTSASPSSPSPAQTPAGSPAATAPRLARRLFLLGAAALAAATSAPAAVTDISGSLTQVLDTVVGTGNSGRLTANTQTMWYGTTSSSNVDLNGYELNLNNGGGNSQYYNGAITGPGTLRTQGNGGGTWVPDIQLGGTTSNTPTNVILDYGRITMNKTAGVDALAGTITASSGNTKYLWWLKSNQISDTATINSVSGTSGVFTLKMNGFNERIGTLSIKTGNIVDTGAGGVLNVDHLIVDGVEKPKGAYTVSAGYVIGSGYIDVQDFGPPIITLPPGAPSTPVPADTDNTVNPAYLSKLTWTIGTDATSYDVYLWLATDPNPVIGTTAPNGTVSLPEFTLPAQVLSLTNYKWKVVSRNSVGTTPGPQWTFSTIDRTALSGTLPTGLDAIVGAGNTGRLVGNTQLYWDGVTSSVNINLNGFQLTHNSGGGNAQTYNGAITGPGTLQIMGRGDGSWGNDPVLGGTSANSMTSVIVTYGHLQLNKTAGVDALAGTITVNPAGGQTAIIELLKSNQINDASTIDSTTSGGNFVLQLGNFTETIAGLSIKTGHTVDTGTGGVLTVTNLTVGGVVMAPGTYTSSSAFVTGTGSVVVPGATTPADAGLSTVTASPSPVQADGISTSTITVTLLDATSAPVTGKAVSLVSSRGATDTISAPSGTSNPSGVVTFTVKSSTPGSPVLTATDITDSVTLTHTASVTFAALPPASAGTSTVAASPGPVVANGVSTSTITVTLKDGGGGAVTGKTVTLASSRGSADTISAASGSSNASGVVTFTVKSTTAGSPVFTATDTTDSITVIQTASVTFTTNPAASVSQSTVAAAPSSLVANGTSITTITVTLKDSGGTALAGKTVTLASSRGAADTISAASGVSNISGVVTFTVTSTTAGAPIFTATDSTDSIVVTQTAAVTFTAATNVTDISNATTPWEPANTGAGVKIDAVVASGYSARLIGTTQTHWASGGFSRAVDINGNSFIIDTGGGNAFTCSGAISGNGTVTINAGGSGVLYINGAVGNTYTGTTIINNGPVSLGKTSGNALNGTITVNGSMSANFPGTGNLLWAANNQINDSSNLTLTAGSSINLNGHSDTMGTLAITGDANIYLTGSNSVARFADSSAATWTANKQLIIREWNGSPTGGGTEGVFFGSSSGGLTVGQVANVGFMNPTGFATGLYHAAILSTGEVVPTGSPVVAVNPPYDISPAAAAARALIYTSTGRADLTKAGTPLTTGTRIVFFGDSITWLNGYISLLNSAITSGAGTSGKTITLVNRGINGGGVIDIRDGSTGSGYPGDSAQASFSSLLTSDQATIAVVYIGINDVNWRNTPTATFEQGLRDLAATAAAKGVKLIFATPSADRESPIGADPSDPRTDQFAGIVRTVAASTGATLVDLRAAFVAYWKNNNYEIRLDGSYITLMQTGMLTYDGIHPSTIGTQLIADKMAEGILASYGSAATAFDTWIGTGGKGLTGTAAGFGADPDHDGVPNGIEFVLGSEPNPANAGASSTALQPTVGAAGNNLVFTYNRTHASAYLNPVVEFNTGLQGTWTTATAGNSTIAVTTGGTSDTVTVTIPKGANTQMFARLKVAGP